jgi:hypothetical protein
MTTEALSESRPAADGSPKPMSREKVSDILQRAEAGDEKCLSELLTLLDDGKWGKFLTERCGSPAEWLESRLIQQQAGKDIAIREAMKRKLSQLRNDLAGPSPTPLERLLVERAVVLLVIINIYESQYIRGDEMTLRQPDDYQRRIDAAHSRFLSAVKTLATIRKLALPALQVNIGEESGQLGMIGGRDSTPGRETGHEAGASRRGHRLRG